jgi:predicted KAP-like P-loop ATPase
LPASEPALLERALTAAENLQHDDFKARALSAIAPHLPASEQRAVLERALTAAENLQHDYSKAIALSAIAPRLPKSEPALLERALAAADNLQDDRYKAQVLSAIAPQISQSNLKRFLEATFSLSNAAESLASPAIHLTKDFLQLYPSSKHSTALHIVQYIPDNADKTKFLSALIPRLAVGLLPNALRLIQETFTADRYRTEALNNLVSYLPEDQLSEALELIIQYIKNPHYKTSALEVLIPFLPIEHFKGVLDLVETKILLPQHKASILQTVAIALTTEEQAAKLNQSASSAILSGTQTDQLAPHPYIEIFERIFRLTQQLQTPKRDDFSCERATSTILGQLVLVLQHLSAEDQQAFQSAVSGLNDPGYRAIVLIALAPYSKGFVQASLTTFIGNDYNYLLRIKIQLALIDSSNFQAGPTLNFIKSPYRKAEARVEIACHSAAGANDQINALRALRSLTNNAYLQTQYLQRLIPSLLKQLRFEASNVIGDISDPYHRVTARVALARKFPESEFFNSARDGTLALESKVQQIEQLSTLAIDMPELLPRIIKLAETAETPKNIDRYGILVALAPHLPMRINREVKRCWALSNTVTDDLWERALYLLARSYRDALTGGTLRNDTAQDRDLLDLKDEINALSGLLLMRDLEPPMTVGILGGWGGGKSYIMHLMQQRMTDVRSGKVDPEVEAWNTNPNHEKLSPYVGHIYQIKFDAWTFAKSDLWASLMQTIFFELNRQISLEQQLARVLAEHPEDPASRAKALCEAGQYWPVLYKSSDQDRQWFLERVLSPAQLIKFKDIHNQGQVDDELWRQLGATYQAENQKLTELETELRRKQDELRIKTQAIRSQVDDNQLNQLILKLTGPVSILLSNRISQPVLTRINRDITRQVKAQLSSQAATDAFEPLDIEHLNATVQAVATGVFEQRYGEISFRSFLTWFQKNLRLFGLMLVFLTLAILLPIAADALLGWLLPSLDSAFPKLIAFLAPLTPGLASAQTLLKSSQKWAEETNLAVKEYEQQLEALPKQLEDRREQLFQTQLDKVKEVADLEADVKQLEEKVSAQRQRIPENVYESLEAFVSDRIQDGSYEKRLGLMQQVKGDLAELSNRLLPPPADSQEFQWKVEQLQKVFPRGPARVVVYIDDLDRCPPDRVVQVLEAVQLLVKTPLFIAVLAIDERYITRALEQFYKGVLLRHGSPSGTDYLEKIIQLPYRVRPIMANTLETYLRAQVVIQDNATGGTKFSELSRQEFNLLLDCCKQVDLSPRTLKRLTNVYKLFKIVCRTRGTKPSLQVQQAILALLALSGRYATLMRGIFADIETVFEEQRDKAKADAINAAKAKRQGLTVEQLEPKALYLQSPLKDFFEHYSLPTSDQYLQLEFDKLQHDALQTNILPSITLEAMTPEIFNLIRSFSFVGDIGEDSDDYRYGRLAQTGVSHPAT